MNALSTSFYQLFGDNVAIRPDKPAVVDGDRSVTYGELAIEIDQFATYFAEQGIAPGDRVVVSLRKSALEVAAMFAVSKVGAVVVNANVQLTPEQLAYVTEDSGAKLLIVEPSTAKRLQQLEQSPGLARVMVVGNGAGGEEFATWKGNSNGRAAAEVVRLDTELAMIIYTSGSTGRPKGVMLSHRNIVMGARCVARYLKLGSDERLLSVLPYSFDYGLNQLTTMMLLGGTIVHQPVAMAAEIIETVRKNDVTGLAAVPPLWGQLARLLERKPVPLPSLRRLTNTGGKIPDNVLQLLPRVFPDTDIYLMYGLTEAFRSTYLPPEKFASKTGAIGRAIPGVEIFVIKADGGIAGPGEQGELVHRGPLISLGYWNQPEATAEKIRPCPELAGIIGDEPVVYSGDIVRVDEDGDLWFVGRNNAMIKTGSGFRISPDEVEGLVHRSGMVGDAVAFGFDDAVQGGVVHVAVTPLDGFDEGELLKHCRRVMPAYMVPHKVHVWNEPMPRASTGKIARPEVIREGHAKLAGGIANAGEYPSTREPAENNTEDQTVE